jgi:hypothetical protein
MVYCIYCRYFVELGNEARSKVNVGAAQTPFIKRAELKKIVADEEKRWL